MATIKVVPVPMPAHNYELTLSFEEAQVLRELLHRVGGDIDGDRKHAEAIKEVLQDAGFKPSVKGRATGSICLP